MKLNLPALIRTTTFRVAVLHTVFFTVFMLVLLVYLYASTVVFVRREASSSLETELSELQRGFDQGGLVRLVQSVHERSAVPGSRQFIYSVVAPDGTLICCSLGGLPPGVPPGGPHPLFFNYEVEKEGEVEERSAEGRVLTLEDGSIVLVAYDLQEFVGVTPRITRVVWTMAPIGFLLSLIGGIFVSRSAAQRADELSRTARAVMNGDLTRRANVAGSGDEFDHLAEQLNNMLSRIEQLMQARRYVGDSIAHDLRRPLTHMRNRLEDSLNQGLSVNDAEATLHETLGDVDNVLDTFSAILRLSQLEGGQGATMAEMDVSASLEVLADLFEPACEEAGLMLVTSIGRNLTIEGDRGLIEQAMANLIDNAMKYTPAPGEISLEAARARDGMLVLRVVDSGPGIPAAKREDAVKRFVRLEESRSKPGSGLGLALVAAVAELHKGAFELEDGSGTGDRPGLSATLRLPRS